VRKKGFVVEFGEEAEEALIMTTKEYEENEKTINKIENNLEDEERKMQDDLKR
jgi:hypothetical protein